MSAISRYRSVLILTALCIVFFLNGLAIIPQVGVQTDEAIFTSVLFPNSYPWFTITAFEKKIPLMVMTYMGSLKAGIYALIFRLARPSVYTLRVPVLVAGVASLLLFYLFLSRSISTRSALFGTALLAFDTSYLLTTVFDWGPVAIQHVCLLGGMALVLQAVQTGRDRPLAAGFFVFGLGLWDKAIFLWMFSAAGLATILVFPYHIKRIFSLRRLFLSAVFLILGALPLVIYNVLQPLETFRGNTTFDRSPAEWAVKANLIRVVADGSVFFGIFAAEDDPPTPRRPKTVLQSALAAPGWFGIRHHLLFAAILAAAATVPLLLLRSRFRPATLFCLILLLAGWLQMAGTQGAGGGAHHTILLWPFPLMLVAISMEWLAERIGARGTMCMIALAVVLCGSCLLVTGNMIRQAIRKGAPGAWTDAIFVLHERLRALQPNRVLLMDWGLLDNLRMLQKGSMTLFWGTEPLMQPEPTPADLQAIERMLALTDTLFVSNTDNRQIFTGVNARLRRAADRLGYRREVVQVVHDQTGRPCYEIFRFYKKT